MPLLRQQVLLLARHHPDQEHVRPPGQPDLEGGQPSQQGLQVPGVQEEELVEISKEVNTARQYCQKKKIWYKRSDIGKNYMFYLLGVAQVIISLVPQILFSCLATKS